MPDDSVLIDLDGALGDTRPLWDDWLAGVGAGARRRPGDAAEPTAARPRRRSMRPAPATGARCSSVSRPSARPSICGRTPRRAPPCGGSRATGRPHRRLHRRAGRARAGIVACPARRGAGGSTLTESGSRRARARCGPVSARDGVVVIHDARELHGAVAAQMAGRSRARRYRSTPRRTASAAFDADHAVPPGTVDPVEGRRARAPRRCAATSLAGSGSRFG